MSCRNPCRLYIHLAFTYSVGPSSLVRSEREWDLPFPAMRVLEVHWSWALGLMCEVAVKWVGAKQPVHSFLGGKGLGIQQGTGVWVGSPISP